MALVETEILSRFLGAALIGIMIGFSRRKKPAGIRTFALLCLGAAAFTVVSISTEYGFVDHSRIIAQIVAGVGFLGLGVIWRVEPGKPGGITTAATVWVTAAIGIMIGLGMWPEVLVGTILTLAIIYSKPLLVKLHLEEE